MKALKQGLNRTRFHRSKKRGVGNEATFDSCIPWTAPAM
ncbi:MAG: hypothetical protein ACI9HK_001282, partial [Pirellulaceae bacterium]